MTGSARQMTTAHDDRQAPVRAARRIIVPAVDRIALRDDTTHLAPSRSVPDVGAPSWRDLDRDVQQRAGVSTRVYEVN